MKKIFVLLAFLFAGILASAQVISPVKWSYAAKKDKNGTATVFLKATIEPPWHIYSVNQKPGGPAKTSFTFVPSKDYTLVGRLDEPTPISRFEEVFGLTVNYFEKSVVFSQRIKLKANETLVKGKVSFMACTNKECLPPDEVEFSIPIK